MALYRIHEKYLVNNKVHLTNKLFNLKIAKDASISQHRNKFNMITNQFLFVNIKFDDEMQVLIMLTSLPNY